MFTLLLSGCLSKLEDAVEKTNLTTKELELLQSKYGALTLMSHPEYSPHARYLGARKCFLDTEDREVYMYVGALKKLSETMVPEFGIPNVTVVMEKQIPEVTELLPFPPVNLDTYYIMELTVMTLLNRYAGALGSPLSGSEYDEIRNNVERMLVHVAPTVLGALKAEFVKDPKSGKEELKWAPVRGTRRFNRKHAIELMHSIVAAFTATQGKPLSPGIAEAMERNIEKITTTFK
jgi:hypothetical protein